MASKARKRRVVALAVAATMSATLVSPLSSPAAAEGPRNPAVSWFTEFMGPSTAGRPDGEVEATSDDVDGDGITIGDNCPVTSNADQFDVDQDGVGDACDNCAGDANPQQEDADDNDIGDACETAPDGDEDGTPDTDDNCPDVANGNQTDIDGDDVGDACDPLDDRPCGERPPRSAIGLLLWNLFDSLLNNLDGPLAVLRPLFTNLKNSVACPFDNLGGGSFASVISPPPGAPLWPF